MLFGGLLACAAFMGGCSGDSGGAKTAPSGGNPPAVSGGQTSSGKKEHRIVFIFKSAGQYSEACRVGAEKANTEFSADGVKVEYFAPDKAEVAKQIAYIDQMISQGVDAIVISPNDDKAIVPIIKKAIDANVKVFTWDSDAPTSARIFYVAAADDIKIGVDIAEALAKDVGGKGKVAIMTGGRAAANTNLHVDGVREGLKKYPDIKIIEPVIYNDEDQKKAVDLAKAAFQKDPDIAGFAGVNSQAPPGIGEAVKQLNKIGAVKVWGLALPSATKDYLHSGAINGVMLWDPGKLTYLTAKLVKDYLNGTQPKDGDDIPDIGKLSVKGGVVIMPGVTFTKENVDQYNF
jgi:ABC-type sugar transport system substrate-binding protein